jgi:hypothetical protein
VDALETELITHLKEPSQGAFAIADEFIDQITCAKSAKKEMKEFYRKIKAKVWPEHFEKIRYWSAQQQEWHNLVSEAIQLNEAFTLQFRG